MNLFHHKIAVEVPVKYRGQPQIHRLMNAWAKRGRVTEVLGERTYLSQHGVMVRDQIVTIMLQHNDDPEGTAYAAGLETVKFLLILGDELIANVIANGVMTTYSKEDML